MELPRRSVGQGSARADVTSALRLLQRWRMAAARREAAGRKVRASLPPRLSHSCSSPRQREGHRGLPAPGQGTTRTLGLAGTQRIASRRISSLHHKQRGHLVGIHRAHRAGVGELERQVRRKRVVRDGGVDLNDVLVLQVANCPAVSHRNCLGAPEGPRVLPVAIARVPDAADPLDMREVLLGRRHAVDEVRHVATCDHPARSSSPGT
eukprot:768494-Hanusia_phi.AAC.5